MSTIHLEKLLNPQSLVIIGASDRKGSPGKAISQNVIDGGYTGELFLVNPRYKSVCNHPCLRSLKQIDSTPDMAIMLVPQRIIRRTMIQAARRGIRVAIVMSAVRDSQRLHELAQSLGIRLLGPYCAGIIRPSLELNATYSPALIVKGSLAMVTQSASMGAAIVDWAEPSGVGFSAVLSTGANTDVTLADLLDVLAEDHHTRAIIVYLDRIVQMRSFLSAISAAARIKPVVLMKSTQDAARYCDALNRSGQIYSTDQVLAAAMNRAGVVRIRTFSNVFLAAQILTSGMRVKGRNIAVLSNGAAPAMLAYERIASKSFKMPPLAPDEHKALKKQFRHHARGTNPIVLRHPVNLAEHYQQVLQQLQDSGAYDAIIVIFVPDARNDPGDVAAAIIAASAGPTPVLTSFMGENSIARAREQFGSSATPCFRTPEAAVDAFDFLHRYLLSQQMLLQLPAPAAKLARADVASAQAIIDEALHSRQRVPGPQKTRELLACFDIDTLQAKRVTTLDDARNAATSIGYPVALKLVSPNITYRAEVIGTLLDIQSEEQLVQAYNNILSRTQTLRPNAEFRGVLVEAMYTKANHRSLALAVHRDSTFGPVISIGIGGDLTALFDSRAVQLPPLNDYLIDDLLSTPGIATYLGEFRHQKAVGTKMISQVLSRLSDMACELPELFSIHINPLQISANNAIAMGARIVLESSALSKAQSTSATASSPSTDKEGYADPGRRYTHLAMHPYPWHWVRTATTKKSHTIQMRPIRPEDGESIKTMVKNMSAESRYFRFMHAINELSPQLVAQFTKLDYDRHMAFVAVADNGNGEVVGVSRYTMSTDKNIGEFAISIADNWQGQGLATMLMKLIIEHASEHGLQELFGDVLRSNTAMHGLMRSLGFISSPNPEDRDVLIYTLPLPNATAT